MQELTISLSLEEYTNGKIAGIVKLYERDVAKKDANSGFCSNWIKTVSKAQTTIRETQGNKGLKSGPQQEQASSQRSIRLDLGLLLFFSGAAMAALFARLLSSLQENKQRSTRRN